MVYNIADIYRRWPSTSGWEEATTESDGGHPAPEGLIINVLGASLVALAIVVPVIVGCNPFRKGLQGETPGYEHRHG